MITKLHAIALFLFVVPTAFAQDTPPNFKYLKPIESLIGDWTAPFDPPGPVPEGKLDLQIQWLGNQSYVQIVVHFLPQGTPNRMNPEFIVIGYDKQEKATKAWHFKYLDQGRTDAAITKDKLVIVQQEGVPGEASYRKQEKTYELDGDMLVITTSEHQGSERTDQTPLRLKRASFDVARVPGFVFTLPPRLGFFGLTGFSAAVLGEDF